MPPFIFPACVYCFALHGRGGASDEVLSYHEMPISGLVLKTRAAYFSRMRSICCDSPGSLNSIIIILKHWRE